MARTVLAGDIGGTKTLLALCEVAAGGGLRVVREAVYHSADYHGLEPIVGAFLADGEPAAIEAAAFGIAGPVVGGVVELTNLDWRVDAAALTAHLGGAHVRLMNDLESTAYGALFAAPDQLLTLRAGTPCAGNRAVIAAGTGLGQGILFWDGARHHPSATEGGHVDFGPRDAREDALCDYIRGRFGRVSCENVCSGRGLHHIFDFLVAAGRPVDNAVHARMQREDPSAVIGELALANRCPTCREAVEIFVAIYGAQAGNLALAAMAVGGVYVGGGVVTKLLPLITAGRFVDAFLAKEPHRDLLERIPLQVLLDPKTSLRGAAHAAAEL
ncbi:MAG: glucokinase [Deltaproteobacteria bacterium]|nr:glucokinase [Deltaproteobacteria bacterium]